MKIDRVHFYVEDAKASRDWFVNKLGFQVVSGGADRHTHTEVVKSGLVCFVLSSAIAPTSPVAQFLQLHPPGVADVAFVVEDVEKAIAIAVAHDPKILQPRGSCLQPFERLESLPQQHQLVKSAKIAAWGSMTHTLIQQSSVGGQGLLTQDSGQMTIDHVVLNVAAGDLESAVAWYKNTLGFESKQTFKIQTDRSALHSQVLVSGNDLQFPINEPASPNSQIQEFLDLNRGPGIQHIALHVSNIVSAIAHFRSCGLAFLPVPDSYYHELQQRPGFPLSAPELEQVAQQQILVDWENATPQAVLLQTFTQPIFGQPTFFFELIERRLSARGFGEGNFRALFEAIEREQIKRGSLQ